MNDDLSINLQNLSDRLASKSRKNFNGKYLEVEELLISLFEKRRNLVECKIDNESLGRISTIPMWYLITCALIEIKRLGRELEESDEIWQIISSPVRFDKYSINVKPKTISVNEARTLDLAIDDILSDAVLNNFENFDLPVFSEDLRELQLHLRKFMQAYAG